MAASGSAKVVMAQDAPRPNDRRPVVGVVVTGSGFSSQEREVLKEWVSRLGLQYSGDLVQRYSTHLVCKDLLASFNEPKYVKAVHWGITIVSFRWVYDSLQAGRLLSTMCYKEDTPGAADVVLREATALRIKLAALQPSQRATLHEVFTSTQEAKVGLLSSRPVNITWKDGKTSGNGSSGQSNNGPKQKKRSAGQSQPSEAQEGFTLDMPGGFTFDMPTRNTDALICSPRLCHAPGIVAQPQHAGGAAAQLAGSAAEAPQSAAEAHTMQLADASMQLATVGPGKQLPTHISTEGTVDISLSQLQGRLTIGADAITSGCATKNDNGDGSTPTSGVSYRRCTVLQPTRLDMLKESTSSSPSDVGVQEVGNDHGGSIAAVHACEACSPASAVAGSREQGVQGAPDRINCLTPDGTVPGTGMLYSGFIVQLHELATVTKSRRLVRTDRLHMANQAPAGAGHEPDENLASHADVEDLMDHLEDSDTDALEPPVVVPSKVKVPTITVAKKPAAGGEQAVPLLSAAIHPPRPSLAHMSHSVKSLVNIFQQPHPAPAPPPEQLQQPQHIRSAIHNRVQDPSQGHILHKPMPATSSAASLMSESCSSSIRSPVKQPQQQRSQMPPQQDWQLGQVTQESTNNDLAPSVAMPLVHLLVHIKPEPGIEVEDGGPLRPIGPVLTAPVGWEARGTNGRDAKLSERHRVVTHATSSLVSEPHPMVPRPVASSEGCRSRLGRAGIVRPAQARHGTPKDLDGTAGGYGSTSALRDDLLSGLDDMDLSAVPTLSINSGSHEGSHLHPFQQQQLALGDCSTLVVAQPGGAAKGRKLAGLDTSTHIVGEWTGGLTTLHPSQQHEIMPGNIATGDSEEEDDAQLQHGFAHNKAAATMLDLRATVGKAHRQCGGKDGTNGTTQADTDSPEVCGDPDGDDDGDFEFTPAQRGAPTAAGGKQRVHGLSIVDSGLSLLPGLPQSQQAEGGSQLGQLWPRNPLTEDESISKYLRMSVRLAEDYLTTTLAVGSSAAAAGQLLSDRHIRAIKSMSRAPRNQTVARQHPGVQLKTVKFAEQILVSPLNLILNCRDRTRRAHCPIIALPSSGTSASGEDVSRKVFTVEPCIFYCLPSGEWWLEYYPYYSFSDIRAMATAKGHNVTVPSDFNSRRELMRDLDTAHCRIIYVRGNMSISHSKKALMPPPPGRADTRPAYYRFMFDTKQGVPLTDQSAADFVIE